MDYNVLWLDDHFGIAGDPMENMYSSFLSGQKKGHYTSFHVDRCTTSDEMKAMLDQNECRYQAAILDVFGKVNDVDNTDSAKPFFDITEYLRSKNLIVKVFSGLLESNRSVVDYMEASHLPEENKDYFYKGDGYQHLFKTLEVELEAKLSLYKPYPELLQLFIDGYLAPEDKERVDQLLADYYDNSLSTENKTYFRYLKNAIIKGLSERGIIDNTSQFDDFTYLTYTGKYNNRTKSYDGLNVSDEVCPDIVKRSYSFVGNVANHFHHEDSSPIDETYYSTLLPAMYNAMILVLRWYYTAMKQN